ncbi:hypothetical protein O6H91_01G096300 [Diphasiastrum complanatum]|uniref:Uncharacterized protein n=1 Tax=Diphasiastrum complanatum TaxID=34168 RepID=A0ACC2ETZ4_DIPCM|nr:hypothetical protein O6H91_01G096300 [Diphasiastrum complanatum]
MAQLHREANKFAALIEIETKRHCDLESSIGDLSSKDFESKKAMGGCNAGREKHYADIIHIQILENRLHKAMVDLNVAETKNKSLKLMMDKLRKEHAYYENLRTKMEKELKEKEKKIEEYIDNSNITYEDRNDMEERITDLYEVYEDMQAYELWKSTEGWATQVPIPLSKSCFADNAYKPKKCSQVYHQWIELKALANVQDVLQIDDVNDTLPALLEAREKNKKLFNLVNQLIQEMDEANALRQESHINIKETKSRPINKKLDIEHNIEAILVLLKDLDIDDEEYIPIVRDVKRRIAQIFQEAGCKVDQNDIDLEGVDDASIAHNTKNCSLLDSSIKAWFDRIKSFIDEKFRAI